MEERLAIEAGLDIDRFLSGQSHISKKNRGRLRQLCESPVLEIAMLAAVVLQVATIAPYRRKRIRVLERKAPHLIQALVAHGLLEPLEPVEDFDDNAQLDGWILEEPARNVVPPPFEPVLEDDIPF